jgi:hypothetical protein
MFGSNFKKKKKKKSGKMLQLGFVHNPEIYVELHLKDHRFTYSTCICIFINRLNCTNSAIYSVNTKNKYHLQCPLANPSCLQKSTYYVGIKLFNSLPCRTTSIINETTQFDVALRRYFYTNFFFLLTFWHQSFTFKF